MRIKKMGLLTDPGAGRGKLTMMLEAHHGRLCIVLYLCGVVYFALLAHEHFSAATYFSENALLPGLVESEYDEDHSAKKFLVELKDEGSRYPDSMPYSWLLAKFGQMGLETYTHNFTLEYPLGPGSQYRGKNVYAILRAPRGASTEAVVLSTPYRPPSSAHPTTHPGIALLLSLAKFFRRQKYWAKDLIFLVTEHEQLGTQAWVEAYHQASSGHPGVLKHGDLPARAGAIQAAVNLELRSDRISHIDVKVEGLNGQLPNLDLVNLVHRLCAMESVRHTFKNRDNANYADPWRQWSYSFRTMMSMVFTQATGMTNGNHGLFHRFGIEAVTLEGFERRTAGGPPMFYQMGRVVEGICRSLNNLLERFHQSFFFYLLSATDRYISIGAYMPSLGLMCGALLIRAFSLWLRMSSEESAQASNHESNESKDEDELTKEVDQKEGNINDDKFVDEKIEDTTEISEKEESTISDVKEKLGLHGGPVLVVVGGLVLAAHVLGVMAVNLPVFVTRFAVTTWNIPTVDCVWIGSIVFSVLLVGAATIIARMVAINPDVPILLNIAALLELATLLLAVAMHNFSLALVCGMLCTPIALGIGTFKRWWLRGAVRILWLLVHPLSLLSLAVLLAARTNFPEESLMGLLSRTNLAARQALLLTVVDSLVYGSWAFNVAAGTFLPTWLLLWVAS
ncbi:hypothetical protein R5R35_005680 [Gryllus longicercus]|uniref:GPI-anchor transamidase component GPAA1 n=2 Tax=Gryllus longicercus TaxID=2509291 RepID=A0AAN9VZK3_9ORTH